MRLGAATEQMTDSGSVDGDDGRWGPGFTPPGSRTKYVGQQVKSVTSPSHSVGEGTSREVIDRDDRSMPISEGNQDSLVWRFLMTDDGPDFYEPPGFEPPAAWLLAIAAVARDLRCLRYGRDVQVERLVWEFAITDQYAVTIGWRGPGVGGFNLCDGVSREAPYPQDAVWVADTAQGELTGYEFIQWHREDGTS
jgi:hypothetical protein